MNDPKDIVVSISLGKEEKNNNSSEQSIEEDNKDNKENLVLTEEARFNNLFLHLKENLSKKLFKKTIKEIDVLLESKYIEDYSQIWRISILKIRAILKIIKKKIIKYLINHYEKAKLKHHIYGIKKYFNLILIEFNNFLSNNKDSIIINNKEMVDQLLLCYCDYIFYISFFHKKIGNIIESVSYLSFILRLSKETQLIVKSMETIYKMEKCFILLAHMLIYNEDYFSCIEYLNIAMDICLKNIIFQTNDLSDGVFKGDKSKIIYSGNTSNFSLNKNKIENEVENSYGDKKIKKIILNIVYIYFYRGICYENIGKMKNSIRSYYQSLWFLNHFFVVNFKNFSNLIKIILDKSIEFKEAIDYLDKKIKYYDHIQLKIKNQNKKKNKDEKNNKYGKNLYAKKFKGLVNKLDKLKINEIDTVNKFEIKKNIKCLNLVKREGRDKNIFLSDIRLLNTYLREDFRIIIDKMNKIKSYDMDYQTRERIQKLIRKIYFDQSQRKIKNMKKNNFLSSSASFKILNIKKSNDNIKINNNRYEKLMDSLNISKKMRSKSAYSRQESSKMLLPKSNNFLKSQSINYKSININVILNKNKENSNSNFKKRELINKSKNIRVNSACGSRKIKIYEENKELNRFFNKKYIAKRNYIKKLENRELVFQKTILRLKNTPKTPFQLYNKEIIRQNANESFNNKMTLLISTPLNWKENFSEEEVKKIMEYDKLQNAFLKSLDKNALIKYKEEEKKQKNKKIYIADGFNWLDKNPNEYNKNLIDKLDMGIEELRQREIIENKNFKKLLKENRKYLRYRSEKNEPNFNSTCIMCGNKRMGKYSRNFLLKNSYSSPYFY